MDDWLDLDSPHDAFDEENEEQQPAPVEPDVKAEDNDTAQAAPAEDATPPAEDPAATVDADEPVCRICFSGPEEQDLGVRLLASCCPD